MNSIPCAPLLGDLAFMASLDSSHVMGSRYLPMTSQPFTQGTELIQDENSIHMDLPTEKVTNKGDYLVDQFRNHVEDSSKNEVTSNDIAFKFEKIKMENSSSEGHSISSKEPKLRQRADYSSFVFCSGLDLSLLNVCIPPQYYGFDELGHTGALSNLYWYLRGPRNYPWIQKTSSNLIVRAAFLFSLRNFSASITSNRGMALPVMFGQPNTNSIFFCHEKFFVFELQHDAKITDVATAESWQPISRALLPGRYGNRIIWAS
ncbi:hypothetical protein Ancab_024966 [Ancistrocladus abbreviatus]